MTPKEWTADDLGTVVRGFQGACIVIAAAELDLFGTMAGKPFTAEEATEKLGADLRGMTILLDALTALGMLEKKDGQYDISPGLGALMTQGKPGSQLAMMQHLGTCLRRWAQLAITIKNGQLPPPTPSLRGEAADYASFIEAMDNVSGPVAPQLAKELQPLEYSHLLDVGGASGTWTIAFLRLNPSARATIFDLPHVIPQARERLEAAGLLDRVTLVPGDFYVDPLPMGADLAWVSAIVHQGSRQQSTELFSRVFAALQDGGRILVRDIVMEESRTEPVAGALFAVNMLANTDRGGTFTFEELRQDLASAGFTDVTLLRRDEGMLSVVAARKPAKPEAR